MTDQLPMGELLLVNFTQFFFPNLFNNISFRDVYAPDYPYSGRNDSFTEYKLIYGNDAFNQSHWDELCNSGTQSGALSSFLFQTAIYIMYIGILLLALVGNGVVCYIVHSSPRMRTVTNYFIANLALGDILMSFFCIPFSFISMFVLQFWPFGAILCRVVNYSQAVSVLVSAYTLVAISIDRYIAIMWPLKPRITKR
jgi:7 transmembrane receptor (rhodopsin family)